MTCPHCLRPTHSCKWVTKSILACPACEHELKQLARAKTLNVSKLDEQLELWEAAQVLGEGN